MTDRNAIAARDDRSRPGDGCVSVQYCALQTGVEDAWGASVATNRAGMGKSSGTTLVRNQSGSLKQGVSPASK